MPHRLKNACPLIVVLLAASTGCFTPSTSANFRGVSTPVLLGPRDHVGPSATPLSFTKVKDFETESRHELLQYSSGNYSYVETRETHENIMSTAAHKATDNDPGTDIRLSMVKARSYVVLCGIRTKEYVLIEGDVGTVGGGK